MGSSSYGRDITLAFFGGFIAAILILAIGGITALRKSDVYGLGHWKLNVKMPFTTMWMNLGYWYTYHSSRTLRNAKFDAMAGQIRKARPCTCLRKHAPTCSGRFSVSPDF